MVCKTAEDGHIVAHIITSALPTRDPDHVLIHRLDGVDTSFASRDLHARSLQVAEVLRREQELSLKSIGDLLHKVSDKIQRRYDEGARSFKTSDFSDIMNEFSVDTRHSRAIIALYMFAITGVER